MAADCTDASGTTVTISTSCTELNFSGDVTNLTINLGVTIDKAGKGAVSIGNNTVTNFTNNGTIETTSSHYGLRHTGSGEITTLINNGSITSDERYGLSTGSSSNITTITNAGTIAAGTHTGLRNRAATIETITNSGTISATHHDGLNNSNNGTIGTITNSGTISAGTDRGLRNISSTIETITNSGTISAGDDYGLNNDNGTIETITNSGTISAVDEYGLHNNGTIGTITNSGTISAGDEEGLRNTGTIQTIVNSGTITATNRYGLYNSGTITTLSNSGTISAGSNFAIANTGSIGTFTNTGSLTHTGATAISNQGSIAIFNNSQGKAGSNPVTFIKSLPVNYNVIVNTTNDYGQIEFSSFAGETNTLLNFGIHSSSTLTASTTYSSVIIGLSSSEIASGTSGTIVSGSSRLNWTLSNSAGSVWDLVVAANQDITADTNTSVTTSVKPNVVLGINNLTSVTEVNFANMNTYDCDFFGENNICFSLGERYTSINTPKTDVNSSVMVTGYKLSDTLRVAGFYHSNLSHKTPIGFSLSDKTPLTGGLLVWNQNPNHLGYQLKLANAQQQKYATFTREIVGNSEEGKGQTVIGAKSYVAELQYGYQISDNTVLRPYLAARSAVIKQDAYTETGNSSPLSFNQIQDKSTTVLLGFKFNSNRNKKLSLKGSGGIEHDIKHSVDKLEPTGISALTTVSLADSFKKTRPVVSLGFDYALKPNHRLSGILQYQELPYQSKTETNAYLNYTIAL